LLYQLEQGPTEQGLIQMCVRERRPLPQALMNAPELQEGLEFYYLAFMDLTTERSIGFAEGPIPWSRIEQWADAHDVYDELREDLHYHIRTLDLAYLEYRAKKSTVESPAQGSTQPKGKGR
jgi:hypothetical protein